MPFRILAVGTCFHTVRGRFIVRQTLITTGLLFWLISTYVEDRQEIDRQPSYKPQRQDVCGAMITNARCCAASGDGPC